MSFTKEVADELLSLPSGKTCCRKALLCGLLYNSAPSDDGRSYTARFAFSSAVELAGELLEGLFKSVAVCDEEYKGGKSYTRFKFTSKAVSAIMASLSDGAPIETAVGFRCAECEKEFLRGIFLSSVTITDPQKGNHLEIVLNEKKRSDALAAFLSEQVSPPGVTFGAGRQRLFYKSNVAVSDLLYFVGGIQSSFRVTNSAIERDIRNNENRATNCVASNIQRAVDASRKHLDAIELLRSLGRIEKLPPELQYTASLREENPDASLSELANYHKPAITKSGLNRRLTKILEFAAEEEERSKNNT